MSTGLSSEYSYHSENGPAYHKNPLGASPFKNIKNINVRSFIAQPSEPPSTKIGLQKPYIFSIFGIGRILLILALLGGWIAAVVVVRDNENAKADGYGGFTSTRIAYLVFVIAAFVVYTIIFVLEALNIFNVFKILRKLPLQIIFLGVDIFFLLTTFSVSVACAVREAQLADYNSKIYDTFFIGAFAVAAGFGFVACIFLIVLIIVQAFSGFKGKQPASNPS